MCARGLEMEEASGEGMSPRAIHLQRRCAQHVWWPLLVRSAWWWAAGEPELWQRQLSLPLLPGGRQVSFKPVSLVPLPITIWPVGVCCRLSSGERLHRVGLIFTINPENPAHSGLLSKYVYGVFNAKSVVPEFISSAIPLRIEVLSIPSSRCSWVFRILLMAPCFQESCHSSKYHIHLPWAL